MSFYDELLTKENRVEGAQGEVSNDEVEEATEHYVTATSEAEQLMADTVKVMSQQEQLDTLLSATKEMDGATAQAVIAATAESYSAFIGVPIAKTEEGVKEVAASAKAWFKKFFAQLSAYAKQAFLKGSAMIMTNQKGAKEYASQLAGFVAKEGAELKDCHVNDAITIGAIDMTKYVTNVTPVMAEEVLPSDIKDAKNTIESVSRTVEGKTSKLNGKDVVVYGFFNGVVHYSELKKVTFGGNEYTIPGMPTTMKLEKTVFDKVKGDVDINDLAATVKGKLEDIIKKDIKKEVDTVSKFINAAATDSIKAIEALENEDDIKVAKELYAVIGSVAFNRGKWQVSALRRGTKLAKALVGMKKEEEK